MKVGVKNTFSGGMKTYGTRIEPFLLPADAFAGTICFAGHPYAFVVIIIVAWPLVMASAGSSSGWFWVGRSGASVGGRGSCNEWGWLGGKRRRR